MADSLFITAAVIMVIALGLTFFRLLKGPALADRVVALDGMTIIGMSVIVFAAFFTDQLIYIDAALIYGLVSFIGVVALARYLERGL